MRLSIALLLLLLSVLSLRCGARPGIIARPRSEPDGKTEFLKRCGKDYGYGGRVDEVFEREVAPRLHGEHYLDFTAANLYLNSQLRDSFQDLSSAVYGNPHSLGPASQRSTHALEDTRSALLSFFGADPAQYTLVFTRSATGALDLIGQWFPWSSGSSFAYTRTNHNSVLGMREYACAAGASIASLDEEGVEEWIRSGHSTPPTILPLSGCASGTETGGQPAKGTKGGPRASGAEGGTATGGAEGGTAEGGTAEGGTEEAGSTDGMASARSEAAGMGLAAGLPCDSNKARHSTSGSTLGGTEGGTAPARSEAEGMGVATGFDRGSGIGMTGKASTVLRTPCEGGRATAATAEVSAQMRKLAEAGPVSTPLAAGDGGGSAGAGAGDSSGGGRGTVQLGGTGAVRPGGTGCTGEARQYSLFAYPTYDNFAGVLYPRFWAQAIKDRSNCTHKWLVLADTAAYAPHHSLRLSDPDFSPDFAVVSFYKLFGYPTGVGALLLRKDVAPLLSKPYWSGGAVFTATPSLRWHISQPLPCGAEDGTPPFLDILALRAGIKMFESLGGMHAVHRHTQCLAEYLADRLRALTHSNGQPMLRLYGKWDILQHQQRRQQQQQQNLGGQKRHPTHDPEVQGPTVTFLLLQPDGEVMSYKGVDQELSAAGIQVRSGCMCNPGACYNATGVREDEVRDHALHVSRGGGTKWQERWEWIWVDREVEGELRQVRLPLGALRVSLGYISRWEDVQALVTRLEDTYRDRYEPRPPPPPPEGSRSMPQDGDASGLPGPATRWVEGC